MMSFEDADFMPMEQFPMRWRWTDARWDLLPRADLARIHPLSEDKAREVRRATTFCDAVGLDAAFFTDISSIDDQYNHGPEVVRAWLKARLLDRSEAVWVSFDNLCAVVTDADVFCRYWDTFCYPGGDDVIVWPLSATCALRYHHEEVLYFGRFT